MSRMEPPYAYGSIVLVADMLDPQGRNPKDRPCVIATDREATPEGYELVVAISTVLPSPLPDDYVLLPYMDPRHPRTGLTKKNAAIGRSGRGDRGIADHPEVGPRPRQANQGTDRDPGSALSERG